MFSRSYELVRLGRKLLFNFTEATLEYFTAGILYGKQKSVSDFDS